MQRSKTDYLWTYQSAFLPRNRLTSLKNLVLPSRPMVLEKLSQHPSEIVKFSQKQMDLRNNLETTVPSANEDAHMPSDICFLSCSIQYNFNAKTFIWGTNKSLEQTPINQKSVNRCWSPYQIGLLPQYRSSKKRRDELAVCWRTLQNQNWATTILSWITTQSEVCGPHLAH